MAITSSPTKLLISCSKNSFCCRLLSQRWLYAAMNMITSPLDREELTHNFSDLSLLSSSADTKRSEGLLGFWHICGIFRWSEHKKTRLSLQMHLPGYFGRGGKNGRWNNMSPFGKWKDIDRSKCTLFKGCTVKAPVFNTLNNAIKLLSNLL